MSILSLTKSAHYFYLDSIDEAKGGTGLRWRRKVVHLRGTHQKDDVVLFSHELPSGTIPFERVRVKLKELRDLGPHRAKRALLIAKHYEEKNQDVPEISDLNKPDAFEVLSRKEKQKLSQADIERAARVAGYRFIINEKGEVCRRHADRNYPAGRPVRAESTVIEGRSFSIDDLRKLLSGGDLLSDIPPPMSHAEALNARRIIQRQEAAERRKREIAGLDPASPAYPMEEVEAYIHNLELDVAELKAQVALLLTRIP